MTLACCVCDRPAVCICKDEEMLEPAPACDECCAHANESGRCVPLSEPEEIERVFGAEWVP